MAFKDFRNLTLPKMHKNQNPHESGTRAIVIPDDFRDEETKTSCPLCRGNGMVHASKAMKFKKAM
jgi:hypothetical protein